MSRKKRTAGNSSANAEWLEGQIKIFERDNPEIARSLKIFDLSFEEYTKLVSLSEKINTKISSSTRVLS